jgi:glucose-1-phosphate thymidylyltransferase
MNGGEYQINDGIKRMMADGKVFKTGTVDEWMDCGNKAITIETNQRMLGFLKADGEEQLVADSVKLENSKIIEPCFVGENVVLKNTTIGPFVSIGNESVIENSTVKNSLIQTHTTIKNANLDNAMIGNHVEYNGDFTSISIGDYSVLE